MSTAENQSKKRDFEDLVNSASNSIHGTALRLTRNKEEAKDLAQETLLKAFEAFDSFDGKNFKAWILRILTNVYINKYRRRKKQAPTSQLEDEKIAEPSAPEEKMPDRILFDKMVGKEIEAALEKVPEDFRIAVILSDLEDMTYEEIAVATEVPIGTVRSRIARGRAVLRNELEQFAKKHGYIKKKPS